MSRTGSLPPQEKKQAENINPFNRAIAPQPCNPLVPGVPGRADSSSSTPFSKRSKHSACGQVWICDLLRLLFVAIECVPQLCLLVHKEEL